MSSMLSKTAKTLVMPEGTAKADAVIEDPTEEIADLFRDMAYSLNAIAVMMRRLMVKDGLVKPDELSDLESAPGQPEDANGTTA